MYVRRKYICNIFTLNTEHNRKGGVYCNNLQVDAKKYSCRAKCNLVHILFFVGFVVA